MTATDVALIISAAGLLLSAGTSLLIVGIAYGRLKSEVTMLKEARRDLATKDQVTALGAQISKIEGMFTMTLKSEHGAAA